jgi:hypothetical protein
VFAEQKDRMDLFIRTIGIARARTEPFDRSVHLIVLPFRSLDKTKPERSQGDRVKGSLIPRGPEGAVSSFDKLVSG